MLSEALQKLLALYALNILEGEERHLVEEAIAKSPELQASLAQLHSSVATIPYSAPPVPMAANLKTRLFERINRQSDKPDLASVTALRQQAATIFWEDYAPVRGVAVAKFSMDDEKQEIAYFVRAEAGVKFPHHQHAGNEEMLILEGDLIIDGQTYLQGDSIFSQPGSGHQPATLNGCVLFLRSSFEDAIIH
jgi:hypothetical protein